MYVTLFEKDNGDYCRYWASVSTQAYDFQKNEKTDEWINATLPVRLVRKAPKTFDRYAKKTKNKTIRGARFEVAECLLEAVKPSDDEAQPYIRLVILEMDRAREIDD